MSDEWDEQDQQHGRKVGYLTGDSSVCRTAYLDTYLGNGFYTGTQKHTDAPVTVRWTGEQYVEVHCQPWCQPPAGTFPGPWRCPACDARWYVEEHVEELIAWCRKYVVPTMTEGQLDYLRAKMCGQAFTRGLR